MVTKLEHLASSKDAELAATACRYAALWSLFVGAADKAEQHARAGVSLQPGCEKNWDALEVCKSGDGNKHEMYSIWKQRVKHLPTARNHLRLAECAADVGRLDEAEKLLRAAIKQAPQDLRCRLGLGAVLLLKSDHCDPPEEARECLLEALEQLLKSGEQGLRFDAVFNISIWFGLSGMGADSRDGFLELRRLRPQDQRVRKALELFSE